MQLEGIARQKYYKDGAFIDAAQYAILRGDSGLLFVKQP